MCRAKWQAWSAGAADEVRVVDAVLENEYESKEQERFS